MNYFARLQKLQKHLKSLSCDILLVEDTTNIYYMTGIDLSLGKLLIDSEGACLFVDSRYYENCQKQCPFSVILLENGAIEQWITQRHAFVTIGFDSSSTPFATYQAWKKKFASLKRRLGKSTLLKFIPLHAPFRMLRCIKDSEEIALLRNAAQLGSEGFDFVSNSLVAGISELELAQELEIFWKRKGSKSLAFEPIIAFGANGSMPHYRPGKTRLKNGDSVLIDIGVNVAHYHSDMTRVVFFGPAQKKMRQIYDIVREAQAQALQLCKPGTPIQKLDLAARSYITKAGFGENFTHSLGHGVGLEIHEAPSLSQKLPDKNLKLQEGMVITIEPGIYLPDIGGVRLEDTVVITENGYENLTNRPV
ncbi:MAG: M24 family metallopeptidase [Parachlamydiaceae bacterium]